MENLGISHLCYVGKGRKNKSQRPQIVGFEVYSVHLKKNPH